MQKVPVIFSAPMVAALIDGRKTMTRRLLYGEHRRRNFGRSPAESFTPLPDYQPNTPDDPLAEIRLTGWHKRKKGDLLWVRETWKPHSIYAHLKPREIPKTPLFYRATGGYAPSITPWVTPIHMPEWGSRLTLELVEDPRIERAQAISDADCLAEGIAPYMSLSTPMFGVKVPDGYEAPGLNPRESFMNLWCDINGPRSWASNPWVVVLSFKVHVANVATLYREAA